MKFGIPKFQVMALVLILLITAEASNCSAKCDGDHFCYLDVCQSCTPYRTYWQQSIPTWGGQVGEYQGVEAYSNKGDPQILDHQKDDYWEIEDSGFSERIYIGQKYQCVHYARNYWLKNYGCSFESINTANQIFGQTQAIDYRNGSIRTVKSYPNGNKDWPQVGDLLIWEQDLPDFPAGHVAVIVGTEYKSEIPHILIAEQNYDDGWDNKQFSRALQVIVDIGGNLRVLNKRIVIPGKEMENCRDYKGAENAVILGWVRLLQ